MKLYATKGAGPPYRAVAAEGSTAEELIHDYFAKSTAGKPPSEFEEAVVFVLEDDGMVRLCGVSFFNDPDNPPFYSVREVEAVDFDTAKKQEHDDFVEAMVEVVGNFEIKITAKPKVTLTLGENDRTVIVDGLRNAAKRYDEHVKVLEEYTDRDSQQLAAQFRIQAENARKMATRLENSYEIQVTQDEE